MIRTQPADVVTKPRDRPARADHSAITVAAISGVVVSNRRTIGSNGVNAVSTGARSYFGGPTATAARATVDRPTNGAARPDAAERIRHEPAGQRPILH
jgi:hypothetical protein